MARCLAFCLALSLLTLAPTSAARSVADRDTVYALPGIEIEKRQRADVDDLAIKPGLANSYAVDRLPSRVASTADVLSAASGVHVRRFGGLGAYSAVAIRGSNANQVTYYLDGVPLTRQQYGVVNAGDLPLAALERIDVYRGTAPLRFADAGGGVVQLRTRRVEGTASRFRIGYADFDTRRGEAWTGWSSERTSGLASYQFLASRGAFTFLDDNATPFNDRDDGPANRRNNVFEQHAVTAKLDVALGTTAAATPAGVGSWGSVTLALDLFNRDSGLPGLSAFQASLARFDTRRAVGSATWKSPPWLHEALELRTQAYATSARDRFKDLDNELGSGRQNTDDRTSLLGLRQEAWLSIGPLDPTLGVLVEIKRDEFAPRNLLGSEESEPVSRRDGVALGAEQRFWPWRDHIAITTDIRRDRAFDEFAAGPAFAGGPMRPAVNRTHQFTRLHSGILAILGGGFTLRLNASRSHRLPSLFELYGNRGTVVGNRDLVPELMATQDVGLRWQHRRAGGLDIRGEVALYRSDANDLILFIQNSQNTSVARNVSGALLEGVETSVALAASGFHLTANWTVQETRDRSIAPFWRGNSLPGRPSHEIFTRSEFRSSRWLLFHEYAFVSGNFLDRANRQAIDARHLHHLGAGLFLQGGKIGITAEIENLTDNRIEDFAAFPLPGRTFSITVEARP